MKKVADEAFAKAEAEGGGAKAKEDGEPSSGDSNSENELPPPSASTSSSKSRPSLNEILWKVRDMTQNAKMVITENVKLAYSEMIGETRGSAIKRKVEQASTFRQTKTANPGEEGVEGEGVEGDEAEAAAAKKDRGPSAIVVADLPKSQWEQMKQRLESSPFIREMLKNTKKFQNVAASTDIGQQAQKMGQSVKDKMDDAREFWETSQNPLVYTLSGVWDNITGETEEGLAIAEIHKLDPKFNKVRGEVCWLVGWLVGR